MANETIVRVSADASGYTSELDKAKRSAQSFLSTQDEAAKRTQAAQAAITEAVANGSDASTRKINSFMQSLLKQAETAGKARSELLQMQAASLGVTNSAQAYIEQIKKAEEGTHSFSLQTAGARRELLVLAHEASQGNWKNFGGSLMVLGERTDAMSLLFNKTALSVGAFTAVVAGAAAITYHAREVLAEYGEQIENLSKKTGISTDSVQQWAFATKTVGIETKDSTKMLSDLADAQNKAIHGNKDSASAFAALGISMDVLKKNSPEQIIPKIADAFGKSADGAAKAAIANELFGASGANLIPLLDKGKAGLDALNNAAHESGAVIGGDLIAQMAALKEQMGLSKAKMDALSLSAKAQLLPTIINLTDALTGNVAMKPLLEDFYSGVATIMKATATAVATVVVGFEQTGKAVATVAAVTSLAITGDFKAAVNAAQIGYEDIKKMGLGYSQFMDKLWSDTSPSKHPIANESKSQLSFSKGVAKPEKYHDDAATRFIQQIRDQDAAVRLALASSVKLTEAEKMQAEFAQKIADIKGKSILTADQKSLLANESKVKAALQQYVADEKSLKLKQDIAKVEERSAQLNAEIATYQQSQQEQHQRQLDSFGKGAEAQKNVEAVKSIYKEYQKLQSELNKATPKELIGGQAYMDEQQKIQDGLKKSLNDYGAYYKSLKEKQADWSNGASQAVSNYLDSAANAAQQSEALFSNSFKGAEDAFVQFTTTGKLSFSSLAQSILADIARIQARKAIAGLVNMAIGAIGGGGIGMGQIGGDESGAMFSATGADVAGRRAAGGPVWAGAAFMVGEKGPEIFKPSSAGTIIPNDALTGGKGGANVTYSPVINIDSRTDRAQVQALVVSAVRQGNAQLVDQLNRKGLI